MELKWSQSDTDSAPEGQYRAKMPQKWNQNSDKVAPRVAPVSTLGLQGSPLEPQRPQDTPK